MAWISKLVEKGIYDVGDTIILHLDEIKELKKGTTKNGCFSDKDGQTVNINLKPADKLEVGKSYEYYIDSVNGTFVNGSFAPVNVDKFESLGDLFDEIAGSVDDERAVVDWLASRRSELEHELDIICALQELI